MRDIEIMMLANGEFLFDSDFGRIEEYCAKRLKINLSSEFLSANIKYYTLSFEPFALSRKIITENIYRDSTQDSGIYFSNNYIYCPIYDYIAVAPSVMVQVDAYETDGKGNVTAILKSGIFTLEFAPSLTGEGMMLTTVRPDVKFIENVENAVSDMMKTMVIDGANIKNGSVTGDKLQPYTITYKNIGDGAVTENALVLGAVTSKAIADDAVISAKIADGNVVSSKIADGNITTPKIADLNVTSAKLADKSVTNAKLADYSVTEMKIKPLAVTSARIAPKAVTPSKLDRKYLTSQNLTGYATEKWVKNQNYITDISSKADKSELPKNLSELKNDVAVSFVEEQTLTEAQKQTVIKNIGAVKAETGKTLSQNDFTNEDKERLYASLTEHQDISMKADASALSSVAFSGRYDDLEGLPNLEELSSFTDDMKIQYDSAYAHSKEKHAAEDAEKNIIDGVKVNGKEAEIQDKKAMFNVIDVALGYFLFAEV